MPGQVFHHVERMLDDRPQLRLGTLVSSGRVPLGSLRQLAYLAELLANIKEQIPTLDLLALRETNVSRIRTHATLLTRQQVNSLRDVAAMRRCAHHRMHQPRHRIDTDVRLRPEVPLVALLVWCISGSCAWARILVDGGAAMIVASTIVPSRSSKPCSAR